MKPVHIVILILAGALGGAGLMKLVQRGKPAAPVTTVARPRPAAVEAPAPPAVAEAIPAAKPVEQPSTEPESVAVAIPEKPKPSPMPLEARRDSPRPQRSHYVAPVYRDPEPVERPVAPVTAPGLAQMAPPAVTPSPAMPPPPASAEPEHETPVKPQASVAPAPQPHQVTLNAGLLLPVRLVDGLSSERNVPGDAFLATLDRELVVDGLVIAERGMRVEGRVVAVDRGGKARGAAALAVALTRLHTSDGQLVTISTENYFRHADSNRDADVAKVGGGAVIGAVIGAIAGGGKGAAIGAGVGGAAGAGDVLLTRGKPADLPSETLLTFHLKDPVPLTERLQAP